MALILKYVVYQVRQVQYFEFFIELIMVKTQKNSDKYNEQRNGLSTVNAVLCRNNSMVV